MDFNARRVTSLILAKVNREMYETFDTEVDSNLLAERARTIESACTGLVTVNDAWEVALACANIWMPTPQSKSLKYNSVEYNTVEIFCLCVQKAAREQ